MSAFLGLGFVLFYFRGVVSTTFVTRLVPLVLSTLNSTQNSIPPAMIKKAWPVYHNETKVLSQLFGVKDIS